MQQLIFFIQRFKYFLFFLILESFAIGFTISNLDFYKSKFVNSTNYIVGGIYEQRAKIVAFIKLKSENEKLITENTSLRNLLSKKNGFLSSEATVVDTVKYHQKYAYSSGKIINNNYSNEFNYLTLNIGKDQGISKEMAVINSKGVIGIIDDTNRKYARVQSVLNRNSHINARLKNTHYFGSLEWDGKDYRKVQLLDIPRKAPLRIGDTIETGGKSAIFPEGILIGRISKINKSTTADNKVIITLFNDMSNIGSVYVIKNFEKINIKDIENLENE